MPCRAAAPGGWVTKQWNFLPWEGDGDAAAARPRPAASTRSAPGAHLAEAGRPGRRGRHRRGPRHRHRLPRRRAAVPCAAPTSRRRSSSRATTSSTTTACRSTKTATAPTSPARSPRRPTTAIGLTGLAYRAKLMPVRVLDRTAAARPTTSPSGIRFAVDHGADVINMSFNFGCGKKVPGDRRSAARGLPRTGSSPSPRSATSAPSPASRRRRPGRDVIGVGGTTEGGCLGDYSLAGKGVDLVAPGGGTPMAGCPSVLDRADLPGDPERRQPGRVRRAQRLRRHLDGRRPRLRRRGDGPRLAGSSRPSSTGAKLVAAVVARLRRHRPRPRPAADRSRAPG